MSPIYLDPKQVKAYQTDGAVLIKGLFHEWVDIVRAGIERNMENPGPYASENLNDKEAGRFLMIIAIGCEFQNLKT